MNRFVEVLKTVTMCGISALIASAVVFPLWPLASSYMTFIPEWMAPVFAMFGGVSVFVVITHMQRGQLDPMRAPFKILYACACLMFAASTIPRSQYNTGTAVTEIAFVIMLVWKIVRKDEGKRDQDTAKTQVKEVVEV